MSRPGSACSATISFQADSLPVLAGLLEQQGFYVFINSPGDTIEDVVVAEPSPVSDVVDAVTRETMLDIVYQDLVLPQELGHGDSVDASEGQDLQDAVVVDPWADRDYLIARDGLGDLVFFLPEEGIFAVSWCPAEKLGQIRRLDALLARSVRMVSEIKGLSYGAEAALWAEPAAYYTTTAGLYQRSYMNESLDINEPHEGGLTMGAKPSGLALAIYGEADRPSTVGDVVGAELIQISDTVLVENDTVTVTGEVVRLWNLTVFAGVGELPLLLDLFVADASISFNTGEYRVFVDGIFAPSAAGSLVLSLQGASPGRLVISRSVEELTLPSPTPVL